MSRGPVFFLVQLLAGFGVTALGLWALIVPKRLQGFIKNNYDLLPAVKPHSPITTTLIRGAGVGLVFYGATLVSNYREEMIWLGKAFGVITDQR
jgi:hypothetical protein